MDVNAGAGLDNQDIFFIVEIGFGAETGYQHRSKAKKIVDHNPMGKYEIRNVNTPFCKRGCNVYLPKAGIT
jgi:hypothetical protein